MVRVHKKIKDRHSGRCRALTASQRETMTAAAACLHANRQSTYGAFISLHLLQVQGGYRRNLLA